MTQKVIDYLNGLKDKKVAFVGMGVANVPCAEWLARHGVEVWACDKNGRDYIGANICRSLEELGVHFSLGEDYLSVLTAHAQPGNQCAEEIAQMHPAAGRGSKAAANRHGIQLFLPLRFSDIATIIPDFS